MRILEYGHNKINKQDFTLINQIFLQFKIIKIETDGIVKKKKLLSGRQINQNGKKRKYIRHHRNSFLRNSI